MYYLVAFSILAANTNSPIEQSFAQLARQTKSSSGRGESRLLDLAEMYVEKGVTPDELSVLKDQLKVLYHQKKYRECAAIGMRMAKLLPGSFDDNSVDISPKKPAKSSSGDISNVDITLVSVLWMTYVGDMQALDNDYTGALRTYDLVRALKKTSKNGESAFEPRGTDQAFYGAARMHAILGHRTQALKLIKEAPDVNPSWCGTCQGWRKRAADLLRVVYDAATLPGAKAEAVLGQILKVGYKPYKALDDNPASHGENLEIKVNAAFLLGEIYLRRGDKRLASSAFRSITNYQSSDWAIMAKSRLRKLDAIR